MKDKIKLAAIAIDAALILGTYQLGIPVLHTMKVLLKDMKTMSSDEVDDKRLELSIELIASATLAITNFEIMKEIKEEEKEKKLVK